MHSQHSSRDSDVLSESKPATVIAQLYNVSGIAFEDLNGNGLQDAGERVLANNSSVVINIRYEPKFGSFDIRSTLFDKNHKESDQSIDVEYLVQIDNKPYQGEANIEINGTTQTVQVVDGHITTKSNAIVRLENVLQGSSYTVSEQVPTGYSLNSELVTGTVKKENPIRFEIYPKKDEPIKYLIKGIAFEDSNNNGLFDTGEQPLANKKVTITGGTKTYEATTDSTGQYMISLTLEESKEFRLKALKGSDEKFSSVKKSLENILGNHVNEKGESDAFTLDNTHNMQIVNVGYQRTSTTITPGDDKTKTTKQTNLPNTGSHSSEMFLYLGALILSIGLLLLSIRSSFEKE